MTKKKIVTLCLAAVLVIMVVAGASLAYLTDTKQATNTFTIGNVDISLEEPTWDENNAKDLSPNATVPKDPQVKNDSTTNPCYCYLQVTVPKDAQGQLFTLNGVSNQWTLVNSDTSGAASNTYVYAYATNENTMTALAKGATTPKLFTSVTLADRASFDNTTYDIPVKAYAIQTTDLSESTASGIWNLVKGELGL